MIRWIYSIPLYFICILLNAQGSVEAHYGFGKVLKHKEGLLFDIPTTSHSIELNYVKNINSDKSWYTYWGKPSWVLSTQYVAFGDEDVLGHAYGLSSGLRFGLVDRPYIKLSLQVTTGLAYLDQVYDRIHNPTNNAISSTLNNTTKFNLGFSYQTKNNWTLHSHAQLVHYSNARTKSPNSGINMWNVGVGLSRPIGTIPLQSISTIVIPNNQTDTSALTIHLQQGIGWTQEREIAGGPSFHVYTTQIYMGYRWSPGHNAIVGLSYEYNEYIYAFNLQILRPIDQSHENAKDYSLLIGDQLIFGSFRAHLALGYYLQYPSTRIGEPIYINVGLQYLPKALELYGIQPYVQVHMKSHFAIAESLNISLGLCF